MIEKQIYATEEQCCGCEACMNICPKNAISMQPGTLGTLLPVIDSSLCVECGLCRRVCQYQTKPILHSAAKVYVAANTDESALKKSASGGVFFAIAESFVANGGVVYGCTMECQNDKLSTFHTRVSTKDGLKRLQGSKYVQSEIKETYKSVKSDLDKGIVVLFSGTPCQIGGLKSFLMHREYDNLYTMDLICHGVPSNQFFQAYIEFREKKMKCKIRKYSFRDKSIGWGLVAKMVFQTDNGKRKTMIIPDKLSSYYNLFLRGLIYRNSCYQCMYAQDKRVSDITIGDYWGIEAMHPELLKENGGSISVKKGVSCILVNSEKGEGLINDYGKKLLVYSSDFEKVSRKNKQLNAPMPLNKELREKIIHDYSSGYGTIERNYFKKMGFKMYIYALYYKMKQYIHI